MISLVFSSRPLKAVGESRQPAAAGFFQVIDFIE
jgi:hypothetical protein